MRVYLAINHEFVHDHKMWAQLGPYCTLDDGCVKHVELHCNYSASHLL